MHVIITFTLLLSDPARVLWLLISGWSVLLALLEFQFCAVFVLSSFHASLAEEKLVFEAQRFDLGVEVSGFAWLYGGLVKAVLIRARLMVGKRVLVGLERALSAVIVLTERSP